MVTYADVRAAVKAAMAGPAIDADKIIAAVRDVFMRDGLYDGPAIINAMVEPGTDPTEGGAV